MLLFALLLVSVIFYISGSLVGGDWTVSPSLVLRILVVALIAVVAIPLFSSAADSLHMGELGVLLAFVILIVVVRFILVEELTVTDEWMSAIVISLVGAILIFAVDAVSDALLDVRILRLF